MAAKNNSNAQQEDDSVRLQDLLYMCLAHWRWFVVSLVVCLGLAIIYLAVTPPVFTRSASIRIKDDSKGKSVSSSLENFSDYGIFASNTNVVDELETLETPDLMRDVVQQLHLDIDYTIDGRFHKETLYGKTLPVKISLPGVSADETASLDMYVEPNGYVTLSGFMRDGESLDGDPVTVKVGQSVQTPLGRVSVMRTAAWNVEDEMNIHVAKSRLHGVVDNYFSRLKAEQTDKKSNVIAISFNDVSAQRAEDVLSMLITAYNESWVKDKNQIAISTSAFISERLRVIEGELGRVDNDISSYKSANLVPDVQAAANLYMNQASQAYDAVSTLNNQAYMARYIRNYLASDNNKFQLLPANSGLDNSAITAQITEYNDKMLERNELVSRSSESNPLVVEMDRALSGMRGALLHSIDNQIVALNEQIRSQQGRGGSATSKIASNPKQSKYLLSVERQQKVKEALYLFLLQKREENELSQAFTAYNTRVIAAPGGRMNPTSPVSRNVFLIAILLGLAIPVGIIMLRENMNTTVRGRKDLENLTIPFIGEIPIYVRYDKKGIFRRRMPEEKAIVVKEGSRDIMNEAFRVLRTNLEFMIDKSRSNVFVVSSFNAGSGKTFLTVNTAVSFAIKGKKVIVIDGDLRHGSTSAYFDSPRPGLSDYLGGMVDSMDEIIYTDKAHAGIKVIPVGTIPPNPTELLFSERLKKVVDMARAEFDYVFIDCPPIEIVADMPILEKLADSTIFVVRVGLLERSMLPDLQAIYDEKKYKNMSVILNGTEGGGGRYGYGYGYRYGYRYGYHYGYGYGYHYGAERKKSWWEKLLELKWPWKK